MERKKTVSLISLGCPKNLVDSEGMLGQMVAAGYEFSPEIDGADIVILNTCGFLKSACDEGFEVLTELIAAKKAGRITQVVVAGCMIPVVGDSLRKRFPQVDAWFGPFDEANLTSRLLSATKPLQTESFHHHPQKRLEFFDAHRTRLTLPHTAYIKIADGCDRFCSYCAIPNIRGRFVSKPEPMILDEAKRLADSGVVELVLIAQETTFWGGDLYGKPHLAELLAKLKSLNLFPWIRLLYAYPVPFDEEFISLFGMSASRHESSILPYIDLPLQHASDPILQRMNRRVSKTQTEELLSRLRESIRDLTLRTTFLTGFPGETDDDFAELLTFAKKWRFERAGVFAFSLEAGTAAASLDGQVPKKTAQQRKTILERELFRLASEYAQHRVGQTVDILIDAVADDLVADDALDTNDVVDIDNALDANDAIDTDFSAKTPACFVGRSINSGEVRSSPTGKGEIPACFIGRSIAESPDIDPVVYVSGTGIAPGSIITCEVVAVSGLDLVAAKLD